MRKKKKIIGPIEENIVVNDLEEIFIYKRNYLLLMPIPYKWRLDIEKIKTLKKRVSIGFDK
jgi:hypothetical protein